MTPVDLSVELAGLTLQSPIMVASGTFGYGTEYADLVEVGALGAIVTKGVTLEPRAGNPPPRICETPAGMLNAIGLQNPGVEAFIRDKLPPLRDFGVPVIVNVAGSTVEDYVAVARRLAEAPGVAALELNISCPNVQAGGLHCGVRPDLTAELVAAVRAACPLPLITKLSPNVTDLVPIAQAAVEAGSDALSLINTLVGMAIDVEKRAPVLANRTGGLSGPAIRPVAVRLTWEVARAVSVPLIGMGGIMTGRDALEFILAGATAVAVGTGNFVDPDVTAEVRRGLEDYCRRHQVTRFRDLIGAAQVG
ncbi:MAG TPA: dihydroorotate dehydrogenase [Armatimonadota bacterium]